MPPRKSRRNNVSSEGTVEKVNENKDQSLRRPTRKRRAEEVEVESEEIMSEALSEDSGSGSTSQPIIISSTFSDTEQDDASGSSGPEGAEDDAVEAARRFDQDEEYARQLQEEEYAAAGAMRNPFAEITRRVIQLGFQRLNGTRRMARIHQEMIPNLGVEINLSDEENSNESEQEFDFAHELDSDGHARRHHSDSDVDEDGDHYYDEEYDEDGGTDYSDYEDYNGFDDADIIRMYREAAGNNGGPAMNPFIRLVDFLEQVRHGQRVMNAVGPFIADEDFDPSYEALINLSERIGEVAKKGMLPEQIAKLKTLQWTEKTAQETPVDSRNCPICLEAYQKEEKLMALDCTHRFHWDCAKRWLTERATCPICRISTRNDDTK